MLEPMLTVSPNPVANMLRIDVRGGLPIGDRCISILNALGQGMMERTFDTVVDVTALDQGMYFLVITVDGTKVGETVSFIKFD